MEENKNMVQLTIPQIKVLVQPTVNAPVQIEYIYQYEEPNFPCQRCPKSFFNKAALLNHINLYHDSVDDESSDESNHATTSFHDQLQSMSGTANFTFIPRQSTAEKLKSLNSDPGASGLHQTMLKSSEDISYIIIKTEGEETDLEPAKRKRTDGSFRQLNSKPGKQPVELRLPADGSCKMILRIENSSKTL